MGEVDHELLLLLQRLFLRTEVPETDQQKGSLHQLHRLPLHPLDGAEASIRTPQPVTALTGSCRQGSARIHQGGLMRGSVLGTEHQQLRKLTVHHNDRHPLQQQRCRGLVGPVNPTLRIDDQHRIGGCIESHLQHSQRLPQLRNQLRIRRRERAAHTRVMPRLAAAAALRRRTSCHRCAFQQRCNAHSRWHAHRSRTWPGSGGD